MSSTPYWIQLSLQQYGLHTAVHVVNGLRFVSPEKSSGRECTFEEAVLCHSRRKYAWCLLVSGGNDVYAYKMAPNIAECIIKSMNAALTAKLHKALGGHDKYGFCRNRPKTIQYI